MQVNRYRLAAPALALLILTGIMGLRAGYDLLKAEIHSIGTKEPSRG